MHVKAWRKLKKYAKHGEYNRRVLARHWPEARQLCDVTGDHDLPAIDVLCGGFPCQDLSVAGKRAGLDGARSGLYAELYRITGDLRPRYVVIENVPGLIKYRDRLEADFAAIGYGLVWQRLTAASVGAPHKRQRVFVLAVKGLASSTRLDDTKSGEGGNLWSPPTTAIGDQTSRSGKRKSELLLTGQARQIWPTPRAAFDAGRGSKGDQSLHSAVKLWPTATASNPNDGESVESWTARRDRVAKYSRPISPPLGMAVKLWPTAMTERGGAPLRSATEEKRWPTPLACDADKPRRSPGSIARGGTGATYRGHSQQLPEVAGGCLNPEWVELLMGFPVGWTEDAGEPGRWPDDHAWPAGRGAEQLPHEPSRLVAPRTVPGRGARLRSLGNAVVPHQAVAALRAMLAHAEHGSAQIDLFG